MLLRYIIVDHFQLAVDGAILFAVGLFVSIPVVRYRLKAFHWLPMRMMSLVDRLMGGSPGLLRSVAIIWAFNSTVMFIYMASGFHQLFPKVFGMWTGLNIGIVMANSRVNARGDGRSFSFSPPAGAWRPPQWVAAVCGFFVLVVELMCLFYALALGIRMGAEVAWGGAAYMDALPERAAAFGAVIVPALLLSAIAETMAIRGMAPEHN